MDELEGEEPTGLLAMLGGDEAGEEEAIVESPKRAAIEDFFSSGKAGDMAGAEEAFQRLYDLCAAKSATKEDAYEAAADEEF